MLKKASTAVLSFGLALTLSAPAYADLTMTFSEGAPKDRFTFANKGQCTLSDAVVKLDLSGSEAGLIFDVTGEGAGVEVFQPLEFVDGQDVISNDPTVRDGDTSITLAVRELAPGEAIAFTIDVDDTLGGREITVNRSEIAGALLMLTQGSSTVSAAVGGNASAVVPTTC